MAPAKVVFNRPVASYRTGELLDVGQCCDEVPRFRGFPPAFLYHDAALALSERRKPTPVFSFGKPSYVRVESVFSFFNPSVPLVQCFVYFPAPAVSALKEIHYVLLQGRMISLHGKDISVVPLLA